MDAGLLIFIVALGVGFWLFVIRPQRRHVDSIRALRESVRVGDEIVTHGGLLGFVRGIDADDDTLLVEIAPETKVRIARQGVAAVIPPPGAADSEPD